MKLTIECTEQQANLITKSLELAFRPLMNQWMDMADWLADDSYKYDPDNPKYKELFEAHIASRDAIKEILQAVGRINYPYFNHTSDTARTLSDMWSVLRYELFMAEDHDYSICPTMGKPIQLGELPLIKVKVEK